MNHKQNVWFLRDRVRRRETVPAQELNLLEMPSFDLMLMVMDSLLLSEVFVSDGVDSIF